MEFDLGPDLRDPGNPKDTDVLAHCLDLLKYKIGYGVEFGVGSGATLRMIADVMPVIGFDSFEGLPEDWRPEYPAGSFKFEHPGEVPNATIVVGDFKETAYTYAYPEPILLIHVDCDLYSSTVTALDSIWEWIEPGTIIVFDEFFGFDDDQHGEPGEQRAWRGGSAHLEWEVIGHGREQWAIKITGEKS